VRGIIAKLQVEARCISLQIRSPASPLASTPASIPFEFRDKFGKHDTLHAHLVELAIAKGTGRLVKLLLAN